MTNDGASQAYWCRDTDQLLAALATSRSGLAERDVDARLARYGENSVAVRQSTTTARLLLRQFESPLGLILIFGAIISLALRQWTDASIILLIVAGSTILAFTQE